LDLQAAVDEDLVGFADLGVNGLSLYQEREQTERQAETAEQHLDKLNKKRNNFNHGCTQRGKATTKVK
jgi:hypothetical protein